jgi:Holliday junction resolvasome RuvABC endonuclease subunit
MILGVDPGLANCGWALVEGGSLVAHGVIVTKRDRDAKGDTQRRLEELGRGLYPHMRSATLVIVEWPGMGGARRAGAMNATAASQTAAAAAMVVGFSWGAGIKVRLPAAVTWRSKLGHKRGKDEQLHADLAQRYAKHLNGYPQGELPHVLDAIGLALFGELVSTPQPQAQLALATGAS